MIHQSRGAPDRAAKFEQRYCPVCFDIVRLRRDGKLRSHRTWAGTAGRRLDGTCRGSGGDPYKPEEWR